MFNIIKSGSTKINCDKVKKENKVEQKLFYDICEPICNVKINVVGGVVVAVKGFDELAA